jgi:cytochrome c oxidase assembly protein subunit 15
MEGIVYKRILSVSKTDAIAIVKVWLLAVAALIFAMVVVGGLTRLTESGLSMVEWRPLTGWLPPFSDADWQDEFVKYQAFPQYQKLNASMSLAAFKEIYWLEYFHRLLGRLIGLAYGVPLLLFWWKGAIPGRLRPRLAAILALGGLQGALGWLMVQSGLVDDPTVSHYRLSAHLGLAVLIYGLLLWTAWDPSPAHARNSGLRNISLFVVLMLYAQILLGGLLAGLDGGLIHNTWPSMDGTFVPASALVLEPWWSNLADNPSLVQFEHRMLAYLVALAVLGLSWRVWRNGRTMFAVALLGVLASQMLLGIVAVLHAAPVAIAALHQAMALVLFTLALYVARLSRSAGA